MDQRPSRPRLMWPLKREQIRSQPICFLAPRFRINEALEGTPRQRLALVGVAPSDGLPKLDRVYVA
jgi:hypothetical protein